MTTDAHEILLRIEPGCDPENALWALVEAVGEALGLAVSSETLEEIGKAVPAHPSHVTPRDRGGRFQERHPGRMNPRDTQGRFRQRLPREETAHAVEQARSLVGELTNRLARYEGWREQGILSTEEWQGRCGADIESFYAQIAQAGKDSVGNPAPLDSRDRALLNRLVKDELDYLDGFAADITAGRGTVPYAERVLMYGRASREVFWVFWALGDERKARAIRWVTGLTEHCKDCLRFEAMGWTPALRFVREVIGEGYAPQSGQLECHGIHCRCSLEERVNGVVSTAPDLGE